MSFWQPQLLLVMRQPFDFGVQAFASNIQQLISRQASEAVPVTFLANLLYSCAKLPLYPCQ